MLSGEVWSGMALSTLEFDMNLGMIAESAIWFSAVELMVGEPVENHHIIETRMSLRVAKCKTCMNVL